MKPGDEIPMDKRSPKKMHISLRVSHVNIIVKLLSFSSYLWNSQAYLHRLLRDWPMLVSHVN